jgi:3-dehydroquinate dehydratase
MALSVLVLHGPNLSLLAADEIDPRLEARAEELSVELITVQSNGEQGLLDALHEHAADVDAVLVNPGALASYAWALAEGLQQSALPAIEVLLKALDSARGPSSLTGVVTQQLHGLGVDGYVRALELLVPAGAAPVTADDVEEDSVEAPVVRKSLGRGARSAPAAVARGGKSIGRKPAAAVAPASPASRGKTIGRGAPKEAVASKKVGGLTRSQVRERIAQRLNGKTSAEALASWARETWTGLQKGAAVEAGAQDTIENVLLTLMAGAKASDAMLVAQMAKLES